MPVTKIAFRATDSLQAFAATGPITPQPTNSKPLRDLDMRPTLAVLLLASFAVTASADNPHPHPHPRWPMPPIGYKFEPIPPLGNCLPYSHRAKYNRPSYISGKIAYYIAPSSQEAMSWHEHVHRGSYKKHAGYIEDLYMYPKPWEVLTVGPRTPAELSNAPAPTPDPVP